MHVAAGIGLAKAIELLTPAANAIALAHQERITHRDIKPANIFLVSTKSGPMVKVLDFGIAKVFEDEPTVTQALRQTVDGPRAFTPAYGAPEQFTTDFGGTGPWTDVFGMALIVIEVASGKRVLTGQGALGLYIASGLAYERTDLFDGIPIYILRRSRRSDAHCTRMSRRASATSPKCGARSRYPSTRRAHRSISIPPSHRRSFWESQGENAPVIVRPRSSVPPAPSTRLLGASRHVRSPSVAPGPSTLPVSGENRVCAIMFVDLAGVARGAARSSPEHLKDLC